MQYLVTYSNSTGQVTRKYKVHLINSTTGNSYCKCEKSQGNWKANRDGKYRREKLGHIPEGCKVCSICDNLISKGKKQAGKPKSQPKNRLYGSWEWKRLRYETLLRYGATCMLCGSSGKIVVDHIKPLSKYPELALDPENLQVLCNDCNMGKGRWDETDFRPPSGP